MWTAIFSLAGVLIGSAISLIGGIWATRKTHEHEMEKLKYEQRSKAYVEMLVALEHMLASADEAAPMEGDFGSLREQFEMGPAGRARIAAQIQTHGSKKVRGEFENFRATYDALQKLAMHIWDVQDRSGVEGFEVSETYGLEKLDGLRQQMRASSQQLTEAVRAEMQGVEP